MSITWTNLSKQEKKMKKKKTNVKQTNQTQRKQCANQNYYNNMIQTSSDQLPQQGYESMTRVPCRFYRQVTHDNQVQAYVFPDNNALVPAKNSMYVIFHEPQKEIVDTIWRLGNLDKLKQIVTGQPGICYVRMWSLIRWQTKLTMLGKVEMNRWQANKSVTYGSKHQTMTK